MKRLLTMVLVLTMLTACAAPPAANPYEAEDFAYDGNYLTCTAGQSRLGVDVSSHQGDIDWDAVAAAGVEFAMIRIGFRGYLEGELNEDALARTNIAGARAAGLDGGVYFFSQAISTEEAAREAAWVVAFLEEYDLQLPVVYDWEHVEASKARTAALTDRALLTDCAKSFCEVVKAAGYTPLIYFNVYQSQDLSDLAALREYGFWLAQYTDGLDFPYAVDLWQYTETGTVAGISGKVDLNLWLPRLY